MVFPGVPCGPAVWLGPDIRPKPGAPSPPSPGRKKRCREGGTGLLAWAGHPAQAGPDPHPLPLENFSPELQFTKRPLETPHSRGDFLKTCIFAVFWLGRTTTFSAGISPPLGLESRCKLFLVALHVPSLGVPLWWRSLENWLNGGTGPAGTPLPFSPQIDNSSYSLLAGVSRVFEI